jgi:hypothetical protein
MRARGDGRIVHVDSEVADRPPPGRTASAAGFVTGQRLVVDGGRGLG